MLPSRSYKYPSVFIFNLFWIPIFNLGSRKRIGRSAGEEIAPRARGRGAVWPSGHRLVRNKPAASCRNSHVRHPRRLPAGFIIWSFWHVSSVRLRKNLARHRHEWVVPYAFGRVFESLSLSLVRRFVVTCHAEIGETQVLSAGRILSRNYRTRVIELRAKRTGRRRLDGNRIFVQTGKTRDSRLPPWTTCWLLGVIIPPTCLLLFARRATARRLRPSSQTVATARI